ncbi:MAG: tetratricopeptide repeat protein [Spirochaetales bacterium]|nr:tetratricopeptide repeat protein [Spirochaetales bacterium]
MAAVQSLIRERKYGQALEELKIVETRDRSYYSLRASALYGLGRLAEALESIEEAVRLDPLNQRLKDARSQIQRRLRRPPES